MKREFWLFTYTKGLGSKKGEEARWYLDSDVPWNVVDAIKWAEGPITIPVPLAADAERPSDIEDVPVVPQDFYIVSDRTRAIFEEHSPGDCQFFPIDIRYGGKSMGLTYWAMHCLHMIDCVDVARSKRFPMPESPDPYYFNALVDPSKVPVHMNTFRMKYSSRVPIIRDQLRKIIRKAKITGCAFDPT